MQRLLWFVGLWIAAVAAVAQQQGGSSELGEITFEELQQQQSGWSYFGIGAGYVGGFWYLPVKTINEKLIEPYTEASYTSPLFTNGISGFLTLSLVGNLRIGVEAASGSQTHTEDLGTSEHRSVLEVSHTALQLDYAFPVLLRGLVVAPGLYVGRGRLSFEHTHGPKSVDWDGGLGQGTSNTLAAPFWLVRPTLAVEYVLSGYATVRLWGSYNATFMGSWQENTLTTVNNVPSSINANGFAAGLGLFIGLFRSE